MLHVAGIASRRSRGRTEPRGEASYAAIGDEALSVDALTIPLGGADGFGHLRRDLESLSRVFRKRRAEKAQLDMPLDRTCQWRVERQTAAAAAHVDVSGWEAAVKNNRRVERLSFPLDRQAKPAGKSTSTFGWVRSATGLESSVQSLLGEHGLHGSQHSEQLEMACLDQDDARKRIDELRKMRDLLFHDERKLKRASKIKSKSYRKVHNKTAARRAEREGALGAVDRVTAQKLQLRHEVQRVRERMTLKHKNTSRWAKHALRQQASNPDLRRAVTEQIAMGQELRQKQDNGATAVLGHSGEGVATSDGSDDYGEEDLDVLSGDEGYVHGLSPQLRSVKKVPLPKAGVLSMGFMEKAIDRRRHEVVALLSHFKEAGMCNTEADGVSEADGGVGGGARCSSDGGSRRAGDCSEVSDGHDSLRAHERPREAASRENGAYEARRLQKSSGHLRKVVGEDAAAIASSPVSAKGDGSGDAGDAGARLCNTRRLARVDSPSGRPQASSSEMAGVARPEPRVCYASKYGSKRRLPTAATTSAEPDKRSRVANEGATRERGHAAVALGPCGAKQIVSGATGVDAFSLLYPGQEASLAADALVQGAALLGPSIKQQCLVNEVYPESGGGGEHETVFLPQPREISAHLPGWGSWGGLAVRAGRAAAEGPHSLARVSEAAHAARAVEGKDTASRHYFASEKRDKKAAQFTAAGVPFPFSSRQQFERSLRHPVGKEWNTAAFHNAVVSSSVNAIRGAVVSPLSVRHKSAGQLTANAGRPDVKRSGG